MPRTYLDLKKDLARSKEEVRVNREFAQLCEHVPTFPNCDANFKMLLAYFPDSLEFDHLSGHIAITSDQALIKRLAWQTTDEMKERRASEERERVRALKAKTVSQLHEELKATSREYRENPNRPLPPPELTRAAFRKASREQCQEWVAKYTSAILNAHWKQQDWEKINAG